MSVIMSSPGPLTVGLGLLIGRSSTQIADFIRRSSEFIAIVMSFVIFKLTTKDDVCDEVKKARLERTSNIFVGALMFIGGAFMVVLAFLIDHSNKGNVIPTLVIAVLSALANSIFWYKYTKLNRLEPNEIFKVQSRLYRAKTLVDSCVTGALIAVLINSESTVSYWIDLVGSVVVALYLMWCGARTVYEAAKIKPDAA